MERLSVQEVVQAVQGKLLQGDPDSAITGISTDTRSLKPGDLFFALQGEHADGHVYVPRAVESGAGGVIVTDESSVPAGFDTAVIKVDDPLWAFGDLAQYYRGKFDVRVIGITGSVGKTTTKEILSSILSLKWNVLKNPVNYNNEIGVPLTLFQLNPSHEICVIEMAMRGLGEIRRLAIIAQPSVGVITNIGLSHIERLGSQGAIADAKAELLSELPADGIAILNIEDGYFPVMSERFEGRVISFGSCYDADMAASDITSLDDGRYSFKLTCRDGSMDIELPVLGNHNVYNALAAAAAAYGLGVDLPTIRDGIQAVTAPAMRMELVKSESGYAVLNDAYNSSPASVVAALRTLKELSGYKRKIAVLGDMLELGDYAPKAHGDLGGAVKSSGVDVLVTVGVLSQAIANGAKAAGFPEDAIRSYADSVEAGKKLKAEITLGDVVLVKGSRGLKMEEIVRALIND